MKTIAFFVPQFHSIPLNDKYWGKGFTEWVNVKNAKPLFEGHIQPRVPLHNNYYNLLDKKTKMWQRDLAKKYGIYGFCYYHYWFNGKLLLEEPCEQILHDKELDTPFCFSWANEAWTMAWVGKEKTLIPQFYGNKKEWKAHFDYLLPFFNDKRYIKENGKPLFVIYRPESIPCLKEMLDCWRKLAIENGFPGIEVINQSVTFALDKNSDKKNFDLEIEFEPSFSRRCMTSKNFKMIKKIRRKVISFCEQKFGLDLQRFGLYTYRKISNTNRGDYGEAWKNILTRKPLSPKSVPCAFVDWDNSPRYKEKALIYLGATPEKFKNYFSELIKKTKTEYKKDIIFIFAWNEWGEGGYLEPDEVNQYKYLEAVRDALIENEEFPNYTDN